jgi:hypothetical protein
MSVLDFLRLSSLLRAWLQGRREDSALPLPVTGPARVAASAPSRLDDEQRWLSAVREALRAMESITGGSDAERIRCLHEPTARAEALADELVECMTQGPMAEAAAAGLVRDLSELTAALEDGIRESRYESELTELLRQAAAARSLAHSLRVRVTGRHGTRPGLEPHIH